MRLTWTNPRVQFGRASVAILILAVLVVSITSLIPIPKASATTLETGSAAKSVETSADFSRAFPITIPSGIVVQTIGVNWNGTQSGHVFVALYSTGSSKPGNLLTQSVSTAMTTAVGWQDIDVPDYGVSVDGTYWLAIQIDAPKSIYYETASRSFYAKTFAPFDITWSAGSTQDSDYQFNMRITYAVLTTTTVTSTVLKLVIHPSPWGIAGSSFTVSGSGYLGTACILISTNASLIFSSESCSIASGSLTGSFTVSSTAPLGSYVIEARTNAGPSDFASSPFIVFPSTTQTATITTVVVSTVSTTTTSTSSSSVTTTIPVSTSYATTVFSIAYVTSTTLVGTVQAPYTQYVNVVTVTTTGTIQVPAYTTITSTVPVTTSKGTSQTTITEVHTFSTIVSTESVTSTYQTTTTVYNTELSTTSTVAPPPSGLPFDTALLVAVAIAAAALAGALLFRRWWTRRKQAGELPEEKPTGEVPPEEGKPAEELISPEPAGNRICPQCFEVNASSALWCAKCHTDIATVPVTPAAATPQVAASIKCPHCGQQNAANTEFCTECGQQFEKPTATQAPSTPVAQVCQKCQTPRPSPQARFCKRCGAEYPPEAQEEQGTTTEEDERQIELVRETENQKQGASEGSESSD